MGQDESPGSAADSPPVQWVSTDWLAEHLQDENLTILDVQPDVHDYFARHIPGAVHLNEGLFRMSRGGMPTRYVPAENMQTVIRELGMTADAPVVVYSGKGDISRAGGGLEQPMAAYTLWRFGMNKVYILDGGLQKWTAEERPVSQEFPSVQPSNFTANVRQEQVVTTEQVQRMKEQADVVLLDARPARVYAGKGPWIRPGHIPGAVNLYWKDLVTKDNPWKLKPAEEITAALVQRDATPGKTIIVSCGTGREATQEYLILSRLLNYPNVKFYEGSFTEWTMDPDRSTVTGQEPR
ncbi:MAG: sulfurtransferase [Lentisphaerae bacterium]|nr:sulfurtransferase [Lentisphaerota bacterium]